LARFRDHWDFDANAPMHLPPMVDAGDVPGDLSDGPGNSRRTTAAVSAILERGVIPICIGGDDSVPIPIPRAYAGREPLTILQVDAHLDFRDEIDGVREGYSSPMRRASEMEHVERILQVGLRGVGSARASDVIDARAAGNLLVNARELRERGVSWLLEQDASRRIGLSASTAMGSIRPSFLPFQRSRRADSATWRRGTCCPGLARASPVPSSPNTCPPSIVTQCPRW